MGPHVIHWWSRIQPRVALSSGEAELYAGLKGVSETIGLLNMGRELRGPNWGSVVHRVDATACRAVMLRRGCGSIKHLSLKILWTQEAVREFNIQVEKVDRTRNFAHIMASPAKPSDFESFLPGFNAVRKPRPAHPA